MEKQYVAGRIDADDAAALMDAIGVTDGVDQTRLLASLDAIREYGAALPNEADTTAPKPPELATQAQLELIKRLIAEKGNGVYPPDGPLTKVDAHAVIDSLKAGTYDPLKWTIPF